MSLLQTDCGHTVGSMPSGGALNKPRHDHVIPLAVPVMRVVSHKLSINQSACQRRARTYLSLDRLLAEDCRQRGWSRDHCMAGCVTHPRLSMPPCWRRRGLQKHQRRQSPAALSRYVSNCSLEHMSIWKKQRTSGTTRVNGIGRRHGKGRSSLGQ